MASGKTTTSELADSLPTIIAGGRIVRELGGVMQQLVDRKTLGEGIGLSWNEISLAKLVATAVSETTESNNPQAIADTLISVTPSIIQLEVLWTDRVKQRIAKVVMAETGKLFQNAIERKKNIDGVTVLDGATTSLAGAGVTLTSGHIAAAVTRITSNATERGVPPIRCVLHGFQIKDLYDELTAGVGLGVIGSGLTADVFRDGFKGRIAGAEIYENGEITIDSSSDAKGGVFAKDAIVLVQGRAARAETKREPGIGGGADRVFYYDEYAYGERSPGNWLYEIYSDATSPTS